MTERLTDYELVELMDAHTDRLAATLDVTGAPSHERGVRSSNSSV